MLSFVIIGLLASFAYAAPAGDLVTNLPGLNFATNYNQYSGYLNVTTGRYLHYWFFESQNDPANDPILLWLNGGPGCSSLLGLLTELGPFYVDQAGSGELHPNPYSWNTFANIIFLESPACIGFSFDENDICTNSDDGTSLQNYLALQDFFSKFPEYSTQDFYITGESYAGIYIPTLVERIIDGDNTINLKGFAIGNGCFDDEATENSLMLFGYYHGVIGDGLWDNLVTECCAGGVGNQFTCTFYQSTNPTCVTFVDEAYVRLYYSGLDPYNLYSQCNGAQSLRMKTDLRRISKRLGLDDKQMPMVPVDTIDPGTYDPSCSNNAYETAYLNDPATKAALHIASGIQDWRACGGGAYTEQYASVTDKIAYGAQFVKALIFNGDVDMVCNYMGNMWPIEGLGLAVVEDHREWMSQGQVAGFVKRFANLDFLTFKGSGHMVPGYEPVASLHMIQSFVEDTPY